SEGCAVDVCIHEPSAKGDDRNYHAHLLRTTRVVGADGLESKLDTEKAGRSRKQDLEVLRERWATLTNDKLKSAGLSERVDHRTLEAQGIVR
ncbi:MobA/MobL family protein, partial [Escherichia coli]|uniref:MobA/MobL family protein n=1 Tax=Escherichia coli TaxID=562 RepID=UPI00193C2178